MSTITQPTRKIAVLAANSMRDAVLRTDREMREIEESLTRGKWGTSFVLRKWLALRPRDLQRVLLEFSPHIVHFCGHGSQEGLILESDQGEPREVKGEALANLFRIFARSTECVILNACYSELQADLVAAYVPYVIGMSDAIPDPAAIRFAIGFYEALAAGEPFETAFELGCSALLLYGHVLEATLPVLKRGPVRQGKHEVDFTILKRLTQEEMEMLFAQCRRNVELDHSVEAQMQLGCLSLHCQLYRQARECFEQAIEMVPENAEAHYNLALALIGRRRPRALSSSEIVKVERHLELANRLDPVQSKFLYLLAVVKYDYHFLNGMAAKRPSYDELLRQARSLAHNLAEIERLLENVVIQDRELISILRREI
jgi:tetratricopeptide (TPR) repeat protein